MQRPLLKFVYALFLRLPRLFVLGECAFFCHRGYVNPTDSSKTELAKLLYAHTYIRADYFAH